MSASGPAFYDDDAIFSTYMAARQRRDSPNNTLEQPVTLELAGDLAERRVLDLGCGDAAFGRMVLAHAGSTYLGVEGSQNMAALARETLVGTSGQVQHCAIEDWEAPDAAFDLAVARLSLHYLADLAPVFAQVYQALASGYVCFQPAGLFGSRSTKCPRPGRSYRMSSSFEPCFSGAVFAPGSNE